MEPREFCEFGDRYLDISGIQNKYLNIAYSKENERCQLDIYLPDGQIANQTFPVIIFFHGGAFLKGDKRRYQLFSALQGIEHGYGVVSVNYRLLPTYNHQDYLQDGMKAVDYIYQHAAEFQLEQENIFLWGESAGAFLALSVGLTAGDQRLANYLGETKRLTYRIKGIVSWYAPTNLLTHPDSLVLDNQSLNYLKYRQSGPRLRELLKRLSPVRLVNQATPNLLIQHGTNDDIVSPLQGIELAQVASQYLSPEQLRLDLIVNGNHSTEMFSQGENLDKIFKQLDLWKK